MLENKMTDLENERENLPPIPWKAILTNPPMITLIISTVNINLKLKL